MTNKWAVMVVHGVGTTGPGVTVDAFLSSYLATVGTARAEPAFSSSVLWLEDAPLHPRAGASPQPENAPIKTFPVHLRRAKTAAGDFVTFVEVYWSDLSSVKEGKLNLLVGLVRAIFSLGYVSDQAAAQDGFLARLLRLLLFATSRVLCGPVAALTTLLLLTLPYRYLVIHLKLGELGSSTSFAESEGAVFWFMGTAFVLATCFNVLAWVREWTSMWRWFWFSFFFAVVSAGLLFKFGFGLPLPEPATFAKAVGVSPHFPGNLVAIGILWQYIPPLPGVRLAVAILYAIQWVYFFLFGLLLLAFLVYVLARLLAWKSSHGPGLSVAYSAALLQVGLWALLTPLVILVIKWVKPETTAVVETVLRSAYIAFMFNLVLALVVVVFGVFPTWLVRYLRVAKLKELIVPGLIVFITAFVIYGPVFADNRGDWTIWMKGFAIALTLCMIFGVVTWGIRSLRMMPRLLVGEVIIFLLILVSVLALFVDSTLFVNERWGLLQDVTSSIRRCPWYTIFTERSLPYLTLLATPTVLFGAYMIDPLRQWLHVLTDIINHFARPRDGLPPFQPEPLTPEFIEGFEIQMRIEDRVERVLKMLLSKEDMSHLMIVSHSQGTVIAVDVLCKPGTTKLLVGKKVRLVTMGSPLSHVYQYYFPRLYPGFEDRSWDILFCNVETWLNLYRSDDFVGTDVAKRGKLPGQRELKEGGHVKYWNEKDVFEALKNEGYLPG
jgi:hypothetical protein